MTVLVVVLEYEDAGKAEGSNVTVVVVVEDTEVEESSSPQSFQPDQSPCIGLCLATSSMFVSSGMPSLVSMKGPTLSYTSQSDSSLAISIVTRAPGCFQSAIQ